MWPALVRSTVRILIRIIPPDRTSSGTPRPYDPVIKVATPPLLSDGELVAEVKRLVRCERHAIARLVVHLADMDGRELHLAASFPSLYAYCVGELALSDYEAFSRIEAARAGKAFPRIFSLLAEGALSLTTVQLLARKLTAENHDALLSAAAGRSKRGVQELLAQWVPRPDVPESIRRLPSREATPAPALALPADGSNTAGTPRTGAGAGPSAPLAIEALPAPPTAAPAPSSRPVATPLAPDRYQVTFTASAESCALLRQAKDRLSHAVPDGSTDRVVNRALKALLVQLDRTQHAAADRPRQPRGTAPRSRTIPAHVRRAVWRRDGGQCAFEARSGRRCGERRFLEYHHLDPHVLGGEATVERVELRCRSHNNYEARLWGLGRRDDHRQEPARSGPSDRPRLARPEETGRGPNRDRAPAPGAG
ncbi:MAG TPA: HNH endonuclease [Vicinamibacteria bacterium]|nr:HNH endonuclease [Vicinamibacteria bacterium]